MPRIANILVELVAQYATARVVFHFVSMVVDQQWAFHIAGILREFR